MLSLIYFNYRLPFPVTGHYLSSISSYLVSSNPQHKVTITILGRQFTILLCQILEALGQALTITDAAFVLVLEHNTTPNTDKTSRMCVLFLQSTPQQNWILLSLYHNRSEQVWFLSRSPCSCHNTGTVQYSLPIVML